MTEQREPPTKTIKIGIASLDAYKARTFAIARGEITPAKDDPKIWFASAEGFDRLLIAKNGALLTPASKRPRGAMIDPKEIAKQTPEQDEQASWAYSLVGVVLHNHSDEIPSDQLKWLQGFLRDRLSRPEFKMVAESYGWPMKKAARLNHKS